MKVFFDSSAFLKRYVPEKGRSEVLGLCEEATSLGVSVICYPELVSALCRLRREKVIDRDDYLASKFAIAQDMQDAAICNFEEETIQSAVKLLEENPLKASDAFHIASALEWEADVFASSDIQQIKAAKRAGLTVRAIP